MATRVCSAASRADMPWSPPFCPWVGSFVDGDGVAPEVIRGWPSACRRQPGAGRCAAPSLSAGQFQPLLVRLEDGARGFAGGLLQHGGGEDLAPHPAQFRHGGGPRDQAPHLVMEGPGRPGKVHGGQGPAEHGGQGGLALLLGGCGWRCHPPGGAGSLPGGPPPAGPGGRGVPPRSRPGRWGVARWAMMSPASSARAMCIRVTPVSCSPLRMAQWMGAAPGTWAAGRSGR